MPHYKTLECKCLKCGEKINMATNTAHGEEAALPEENDISICAYCATVCKFDGDFNLVPLTEQEFSELDEETLEGVNIYLEIVNRALKVKRLQKLSKGEYDKLLMDINTYKVEHDE